MQPHKPLGTGVHRQSIIVDGTERTFLVHIPPDIAAPSTPVMILLHGRGIDADDMVRLTGMNEVAEREGFVTVYPNGRDDEGGGRVWPWRVEADGEVRLPGEVPFIAAILDHLPDIAPVDPDRVYLVGFSNGAILAYCLAKELTDRIAAVAAVAGFVGTKRVSLSHPLSLMHIHGTMDRFVPYFGGKSARKDSKYIFPPLADALQPWLEATGCMTLRSTDTRRDPADPSMTIRRDNYGPGSCGAEVEWITIEGGGHTWPGREPLVTYMGKWTTAISASEEIWNFCKRHRRASRGR